MQGDISAFETNLRAEEKCMAFMTISLMLCLLERFPLNNCLVDENTPLDLRNSITAETPDNLVLRRTMGTRKYSLEHNKPHNTTNVSSRARTDHTKEPATAHGTEPKWTHDAGELN